MSNGTRKPMRQGQQNRRGRGRGRKPQNPQSRNLESNGPDVKIRGTAAHIAEKYTALARDAQVAGDSVAGESYLQHAEHYNRIVTVNQAQQQAAAAAQGERMNGSGRDRQNAPAESDSRTQPEAAPAEQGDSSASDTGASDTTTDAKLANEKTVASSSNAPSEKAPSGEAGDDEGLARMMARSTSSSGNGADQEKPVKAAKAPKASKAKKKDSGSDDAGTDEAPDEATT